MTRKHRIYLVDDHPLVREWLTTLINQQADLEVCGGAEDASTAMKKIGECEPDIVIVDISLRQGSGIQLIKDIKQLCPQVQPIVLTMHDESLYGERALRAGARGYVIKSESTKCVIAAIRKVLDGKIYVSERMADLMAEKLAARRDDNAEDRFSQLSDRELEVFEFIGQGHETKQIAATLGISMKTVQAYCVRIKEKLQLSNATELAREAIRWHERKYPS